MDLPRWEGQGCRHGYLLRWCALSGWRQGGAQAVKWGHFALIFLFLFLLLLLEKPISILHQLFKWSLKNAHIQLTLPYLKMTVIFIFFFACVFFLTFNLVLTSVSLSVFLLSPSASVTGRYLYPLLRQPSVSCCSANSTTLGFPFVGFFLNRRSKNFSVIEC